VSKEVKPHPKTRGLGKRIKLIRKVRGLSQAALAAASGVSQPAIAGYETRGVPSGVPLAIIMHLADKLKVPLQTLVYGEDDPEEESDDFHDAEKTSQAKRRLKKAASKSSRQQE
jgi:transcriptional regulator with XRE-family HTH domain